MNKFFPVASTNVTATVTTFGYAIPTGGPVLRIARETSAARVFITFGVIGVTATLSSSMELVSGVVEELEIPNNIAYTYFAVICDTGTCGVSVSAGPRFSLA